MSPNCWRSFLQTCQKNLESDVWLSLRWFHEKKTTDKNTAKLIPKRKHQKRRAKVGNSVKG